MDMTNSHPTTLLYKCRLLKMKIKNTKNRQPVIRLDFINIFKEILRPHKETESIKN